MAALGPCGVRVGVELRVLFDDRLGAIVESNPDIAHAVGVRRLRLLRTRSESGAALPIGVFEVLEDQVLSERRTERLQCEAEAARTLLERGLASGRFSLESSVQDEELEPPACNPASHPLHQLQAALPDDPTLMSHWFAARLPLTSALRATLLSCCCPLKRMQLVVDAMRLLDEPHRLRFGHRFRLITSTPASDNCSLITEQEGPRYVVGEALPQYTAWSDSNSFPHG